MATLGAGQFSARQVAEDIGYTVRTIYNVFGTHQNLLCALNQLTLEACHHSLTEALAHTRRNRLHVWAEALIDFACINRSRWLALPAHLLPPDALVSAEYRAAWTQLYTQLHDELDLVMDAPAAVRHRTTHMIWAGLVGILQFSLNGSYAGGQIDDPNRLARDLIETQLRGLKYAPPGFGRSR